MRRSGTWASEARQVRVPAVATPRLSGPAAEVNVDRLAAVETGRQAKRALRDELRRVRGALAPPECALAGRRAALLLESLLDGVPGEPDDAARPTGSTIAKAPGVAALYASLPGEIDTAPIEEALRRRGFAIAWPRVDGDHLTLHLADRVQLAPAGRFRIDEPPASAPRVQPADLDLVIVPGLGFDRAGRRLGYGRGYYDRLLAAAPAAPRIAPCLPGALRASIPVDEHDQPVDFLLLAGDDPVVVITTAARARKHSAPAAPPPKELH